MSLHITIRYGNDTVFVPLISDQSFDTFFSNVIASLKIADIDCDSIFGLKDPLSHVLITSNFGVLAHAGTTLDLVNITERCQLVISDLIALRARFVDDTHMRHEVSTQTKRAVFQLEADLKYDIYGEEFIVQGGMEPLLEIISTFDGNTQAYALKALSKALCYLNGLEYMKYHPGLLDVLVGLTYETRNITTAREAVSLVFVICTYVDDGFGLVHRAAKRTARSKGVPPYAQLMRLLASGDLDAQINSLTLVNVLLSKAPTKKNRKKLAMRLDSVGLTEILESQQNRIGHSEYLGQVERFEILTGEVCSASVFQLQALKRRITELQSETEATQAIAKQIEAERYLVDVVRRELYRYRQAIRNAFDAGVLINAHAPIYRFSGPDEFTAQLESIAGLVQQIQLLDTVPTYPIQATSKQNQSGLQPNESNQNISSEVPINSDVRLDGQLSERMILDPAGLITSEQPEEQTDAIIGPAAAALPQGPPPPVPPACPVPPPASGQAIIGPQPTKPVIWPRLKMKPLHWKRIIMDPKKDSDGESVWSLLQLPSQSVLDLDDFVEQFSISVPSRSSTGELYSLPILKPTKIRVVSEKRSQAIAIMMSQLPSDLSRTRSAIIQLDSTVLQPDQVQAIYSNLPSKEEMEQLHSVSDSTNLDRPERFLLMLSTIPNLDQRLRAWIFSLNIDESLASLTAPFRHIHAACSILTGSESLRFILSIVLAVGNYMNGGTNRGQADGFNLDILTRLDNSKSRDSSQTLLNFIAQVSVRGRPSVRSLLVEMAPVVSAQNVPSIQDLSTKLSSLQSQLKSLEAESVKVFKCNPMDLFLSQMQDVFTNAKHDISTVDECRQRAISMYNKALQFFTASADYDLASSRSFFDVFVTFVKGFNAALPSEPKPIRDSFPKMRRHAIGEKIGDGNMNDVIASIRKGYHSNKNHNVAIG